MTQGRELSMSGRMSSTLMSTLLPYIKIARVDHWFKNIFMLPGTALAIMLSSESLSFHVSSTLIALASLCLLASANYTINEWLDAHYDCFHPVKKHRPSVTGEVSASWVMVQYVVLLALGMLLASKLSHAFLAIALVFALMGIIYNVPPIRTKDRVYLDVLSESLNNPLRLLMGWTAILVGSLPPSSIVFAYWMGGAFLMGIKRFAEYRFIDDPERAALYRKSFAAYSADKLLLSSFFYALCASFFLAIFLIKYRIEFLLSFPLFAALFTWYLALGMRQDSPAQNPEKLLKEKKFMGFVACLSLVVALLFIIELPQLHILMSRLYYD